MVLIWIGLVLMCSPALMVLVAALSVHRNVLRTYVPIIVRIFQEKPLFIVPRGQPVDDAERVRFATKDGLILEGCYLKGSGRRRGVILFGLEFGSNCWSCQAYCESLLAAGFDVFAYEPRNQGASDAQPGYEPLQWVTEFEVRDAEAAVAYLRSRPDADPRGVGFFGISKGAGACLQVAGRDPYIRCCVTDGVFDTMTTLVPYMRHWFRIYNTVFPLEVIPTWYLRHAARLALKRIGQVRNCTFPDLRPAIAALAPRPLLLIHGEQDTYIKPEMARSLFELAGEPRDLWIVEKAKHNQALHVAGEVYRQRVLAFFEKHLAAGVPASVPAPQVVPAAGADSRQVALFPATRD